MRKMFLSMVVLLLVSFSLFSLETNLSDMSLAELSELYEQVVEELGARTFSVNKNHTTSNEIRFRNMDWGMPSKEFLETMRKEGISGTLNGPLSIDTWNLEVSEYASVSPVKSFSESGFWFYSLLFNGNFNVAGFKVSSISAYFTYDCSQNHVNLNKNESQLFSASYTFEVSDGKAAYDVLVGKLNSLYGDGESQSESLMGTKNVDVTTWTGTNNTGVYLLLERYILNGSTENETLSLSYGRTDSLERLEKLRAMKSQDEIQKAISSNDLSGL